jgi:hypothetical protein
MNEPSNTVNNNGTVREGRTKGREPTNQQQISKIKQNEQRTQNESINDEPNQTKNGTVTAAQT